MPAGDSWETTSGLIDEYILTLEEVWFSKPPNYMEGKQTVLQVRGEAVDPEDEDEVLDDEKENFYSLGDGWEPDDGGESATHGAGKTKLNENSSMGKLIRAVVGLGDDVIAELKSRGETTEASTWRGLRFRFERTEFKFKDRKTGEEREYFVDLPVEFLGIDEDVDTGKKTKPKSKTKTSTKTSGKSSGTRRTKKSEDEEEASEAPKRRRRKAEPKDEPEEADDDLRDEVIQFAAQWEDHDAFMETVLDPDEFDRAEDVQGDEELLNEVLDPDSDLWAASRDIEPE